MERVATEQEIRKRNIECKPKLKGKSVQIFMLLQEDRQAEAIKDPKFVPNPKFVEVKSAPYSWGDMLNVVSSMAFKGRYGRQMRFLVRDKNPMGFIYGMVQINSPTTNAKVSEYMKEKHGGKIDFDRLNDELIEVSVCATMGPIAQYLTGKMQILMTFSTFIKGIWDKKYGTDLKYIFSTSLYGKGSIYNRVRGFKYLGETQGLNCLFTQEEVEQMKRDYDKYFPGKPFSNNPKFPGGNRIFRMYSTLEGHFKKTGELERLPKRIVTPRGVYIYDSDSFPWNSLKDQVEYWKERWYFPRKERIEKGEL